MNRGRWLLLMAITGVVIFALSFASGWIIHDREVRGEGYRFVEYVASVWRGPGLPVLALGIVTALLVAVAAGLSLSGRLAVPAWIPLVGSWLALGLIASAAWPVGYDGHASSVRLSMGLLLAVGVAMAALMATAGIAAARPSVAVLGVAMVVGVIAMAAGSAGRWVALQAAEGTGRHWSEGSYVRATTGDQPTETMTISGETVTIGESWSGSWEWSGWTVVIDNDPACPDSRGAYHAHGVGEEDLRFVMVVDTCQGGARAADLETGIWERVP